MKDTGTKLTRAGLRVGSVYGGENGVGKMETTVFEQQ